MGRTIRVDTYMLIVETVVLNKNKKEDKLEEPHQTGHICYLVEILFFSQLRNNTTFGTVCKYKFLFCMIPDMTFDCFFLFIYCLHCITKPYVVTLLNRALLTLIVCSICSFCCFFKIKTRTFFVLTVRSPSNKHRCY